LAHVPDPEGQWDRADCKGYPGAFLAVTKGLITEYSVKDIYRYTTVVGLCFHPPTVGNARKKYEDSQPKPN
jgi:hypothetical protein